MRANAGPISPHTGGATFDDEDAWDDRVRGSKILKPSRLLHYYVLNVASQLGLVAGVYLSAAATGWSQSTETNRAEQFFTLFCAVSLSYQLRPYMISQHRAASEANKARKNPSEASLKKTFKKFDLDGSGSIDVDELQQVMLKLGHDLSKREVEQMMAEADTSGDGEVSFSEFQEIFSDTTKARASRWVKADGSVHSQMVMIENQKWHAKMCFIPVVAAIICTMLGCSGASALLYHYATLDDPCSTGILDGIDSLDTEGWMLLWIVTISCSGVLIFSSMLSLIHFQIYKQISIGFAESDSNTKRGSRESFSPGRFNKGGNPAKVWLLYLGTNAHIAKQLTPAY